MLFKIDKALRGRPEGIRGRILLRRMDKYHKDVLDFSKKHLTLKKRDKVIDLGCGSGYNLKLMLKMVAIGYGVDLSHEATRLAKRKNRKAIRNGSCKIINESVDELNITDIKFNVATAYCTIGFWPNKPKAFKNIYNLLEPNGIFYIFGHGGLNTSEIKDLLLDAGFKSVDIKTEPKLLAIIAYK